MLGGCLGVCDGCQGVSRWLLRCLGVDARAFGEVARELVGSCFGVLGGGGYYSVTMWMLGCFQVVSRVFLVVARVIVSLTGR